MTLRSIFAEKEKSIGRVSSEGHSGGCSLDLFIISQLHAHSVKDDTRPLLGNKSLCVSVLDVLKIVLT